MKINFLNNFPLITEVSVLIRHKNIYCKTKERFICMIKKELINDQVLLI